jgi:N-hydroxyarylamine O-acetyltransferase
MDRDVTIDLDAYCARIGYAGPRVPTLDVLHALHWRHAHAIPFENLDPLVGRPVRLDLPSLERKVVREGRGGYCFEQNLLFRHALEAIGFQVTGLAARVLFGVPPGQVRPRSHMVLLVTLPDGPGPHYVADVGFGGLTLTGPVRFEEGTAQPTPHERLRLTSAGGGTGNASVPVMTLEAEIHGGWTRLYCFTLEPQVPADYEVANWYVSTCPESPFVSQLMAARPDPDRRFALFNNTLSIYHRDGRWEQRVYTEASALRNALRSTFHLLLPEDPTLEAVLARLTADRDGGGPAR